MTVPDIMGIHVKASLGGGYRVLLQASALNEAGAEDADHTPGSVDRVFMAAGQAPLFLDLRGAPAWWSRVQTTRTGFNRVEDFAPAKVADGYLYLPPLTCDPTTRPTHNDCNP
jgi:hypothetical protein